MSKWPDFHPRASWASNTNPKWWKAALFFRFQVVQGNPRKIRNDAYKNVKFHSGTTIQFIVAGDEACFADSLQTWYSPDWNWTRDNPVAVFSN